MRPCAPAWDGHWDGTGTSEGMVVYGPSEDKYFSGYARANIHREMISDNIRTLAYRDAIRENEARISGRRVIDVGSGTGILSLFAAECGAAHVDSIEASSIASISREIVSAN